MMRAPATNLTRPITLHQPRKLAFGAGCADEFANELISSGRRRAFIATAPATRPLCIPMIDTLRQASFHVTLWDGVSQEPSVETLRQALAVARDARADAVIGLGGGSPMDVAKLVAALLDGKQSIGEVFGIGKLHRRSTYLACLPTTAGTGSEVSPNAILLDEQDQLKKGVISPNLVPDAAYVDPLLTLGVPPAVTGATGIDALTHCIEAYANRFAHPMIDLYALEGTRLIGGSLRRAVHDGNDVTARTNVALGSLYGGLCLGPVNTGAVHALSYPLGGEFHVAHGVANAVLLPHVLEFNLPAAPERYAQIARALGVEASGDVAELPERGLAIIRDLVRDCGIPPRLRDLGIPRDAIPRMARSAMTVTRLLERNVRSVSMEDAVAIYEKAF